MMAISDVYCSTTTTSAAKRLVFFAFTAVHLEKKNWDLVSANYPALLFYNPTSTTFTSAAVFNLEAWQKRKSKCMGTDIDARLLSTCCRKSAKRNTPESDLQLEAISPSRHMKSILLLAASAAGDLWCLICWQLLRQRADFMLLMWNTAAAHTAA